MELPTRFWWVLILGWRTSILFIPSTKKPWCLISTTNVGDLQGERLVWTKQIRQPLHPCNLTNRYQTWSIGVGFKKRYIFIPDLWWNDPIWRSYFSTGLVETTNWCLSFWRSTHHFGYLLLLVFGGEKMRRFFFRNHWSSGSLISYETHTSTKPRRSWP